MSWSLNIEKVTNGFVLTSQETESEVDGIEVIKINKELVELPITEEGEKEYQEKIQQLLYAILEFFGEYGSEHQKYRARIVIENQRGETDE